MKLLVTGGAGFIGSAFVRLALLEGWATRLVNLDKLTYAGNLENLASVEDDSRYRFFQGDICDAAAVGRLLDEESGNVADLEAFIGRPIRFQVESEYSQEQFDVVLL